MSKSGKQSNTLFNYFSKSPKTPTSSSGSAHHTNNGTCNNTTHRSNGSSGSPKEKSNSSLKVKTAYSPPKSQKLGSGGSQNEGDLVWAKLDGYPWWPGLVCKHPTKKKVHLNSRIHVQFFDDPPSRSWIDCKCVKPYKGSKVTTALGITNPFDPNWDRACRDADKASALSVDARLELVTVTTPSDEEEEDVHAETPKLLKRGKTPTPDGKKKAKRRRIIIEDSDEDENESKSEEKPRKAKNTDDDDYKPEKLETSSSESSSPEDDEPEPDSFIDDSEETSPKTPKNNKRKLNSKNNNNNSVSASPLQTPKLQIAAKSKLAVFAAKESPLISSPAVSDENRNFSHLSYDFLKPEKLMDAKRRRPDHPDYDPRTLHVPDDFKNQLTPAMRQWWDLKSRHFDVILFFKMGKFYELYHTDAVIAVRELGLLFMKGESAHCGFPEIAFGRYSSALIEKGYKVARVEQTETPDMMAERCKSMSRPTKFDKVVRRELCQITSKGTRTYNAIEGDCSHAGNDFLLALTERGFQEAGDVTHFGVAFVDTSIGVFFVGQFEDDRFRSRLSTLLAHYSPVQVLSEKRALSPQTLQLINNSCPGVLHEFLNPDTEFWEASKTLRYLAEGDYFKNEEGTMEWPAELKVILDDSSSLGLVAKDEYMSAVRALGALCFYLTDCKLDQELLSRRSFRIYEPPDATKTGRKLGRHMIVDGMTLRNLDILVNSVLQTNQGTLLERLDRCSTPFGQRLLRHWLCTPLCQPTAINDRLDAVEDLMDLPQFDEIVKILKSLPDLERLLNKIHGQGSALRAKNHPDSRAVFFEEAVYSKKKISDFLAALEGFGQTLQVPEMFGSSNLKSKLLKKCVNLEENGGQFPDMGKILAFFKEGFDHAQAKKEGKIIPRPGVDSSYDEALQNIDEVNEEAEKYLQDQKRRLGCKITYVGSDKKRFQLEIPDSAAKKVDDTYELQGQRKGFKKYITAETKDFLARLLNAEEQRDAALKDVSRRVFEQFDKHRTMWEVAVNCVGTLDVLMALALYARNAEGVVCRPKIVTKDEPYLRLVEGRHPCHSQMFVGGDFIPNDVFIGCEEGGETNQSSLVLVTGPNMGGKSTLMRQVGVTVIMAQMGCFVPAAEFELAPVDRLFTRLGASDHILAGESTFFVELSETAAILKHATPDSLVLLDELGRGTATFDGTAIAYAVVEELCDLKSRTLFSTHYHSLVHDLADQPQIALGHMSCVVENDNIDDPSEENIVFLYKFVKGPCPKSYGFHAARLAGLPQAIISRAYQQAKNMEASLNFMKAFQTVFNTKLAKGALDSINWNELD